jgi:hypothetical protein
LPAPPVPLKTAVAKTTREKQVTGVQNNWDQLSYTEAVHLFSRRQMQKEKRCQLNTLLRCKYGDSNTGFGY